MTAVVAGRPGTGAPDTPEQDLLRRVLDALLREDHLGLTGAGAPATDPALPAVGAGESWWQASLPDGRRVALPVRPDGFLADHAVAAPLLVLDGPAGSTVLDTLAGVLAALAPDGDAEARAGWADFTQECEQALATVRLHEVVGPQLRARLADEPTVAGFAGLLRHEALAALRDHPVHPTGRCRWGMGEAELRRFAPEFQPVFGLRWVMVPRAHVRLSPALDADGLPGWWPSPTQLGAGPGADRDHLAMPVHPLTAERGVPGLVAATGPTVTPTLSTRTVVLAGDPSVHLKLPLPTATLGRRNRRTITPGTLADGDTVHRLLAAVLRREPRLRRRVLLADESHWIDSPDELLAVLVRRYPAELAGDTLIPVAALLAADPHRPGATLLDGLAARHTDADPIAWFDAYLSTLLDWHLALWLRYGIALEAHQQNITVATRDGAPDWLRLVYKDDDGARIDCARLAAALGADAPLPVEPAAFHDRRIAVSDPAELADMVVTITLHLCVGALVVEHAGADADRRERLFALARVRIEEAAARWCDPGDPGSVAAAGLLRHHVLDAERWPVKAMVTAGTLLPKHRLGCADVNKHYLRSGPNYLRTGGR